MDSFEGDPQIPEFISKTTERDMFAGGDRRKNDTPRQPVNEDPARPVARTGLRPMAAAVGLGAVLVVGALVFPRTESTSVEAEGTPARQTEKINVFREIHKGQFNQNLRRSMERYVDEFILDEHRNTAHKQLSTALDPLDNAENLNADVYQDALDAWTTVAFNPAFGDPAKAGKEEQVRRLLHISNHLNLAIEHYNRKLFEESPEVCFELLNRWARNFDEVLPDYFFTIRGVREQQLSALQQELRAETSETGKQKLISRIELHKRHMAVKGKENEDLVNLTVEGLVARIKGHLRMKEFGGLEKDIETVRDVFNRTVSPQDPPFPRLLVLKRTLPKSEERRALSLVEALRAIGKEKSIVFMPLPSISGDD